jgi:hypothetical protein
LVGLRDGEQYENGEPLGMKILSATRFAELGARATAAKGSSERATTLAGLWLRQQAKPALRLGNTHDRTPA